MLAKTFLQVTVQGKRRRKVKRQTVKASERQHKRMAGPVIEQQRAMEKDCQQVLCGVPAVYRIGDASQ